MRLRSYSGEYEKQKAAKIWTEVLDLRGFSFNKVSKSDLCNTE